MDWFKDYKKQYQELKKSGKPFFPYAVFKDTVVALVVLIALAWLAVYLGAELEDIADPTDTSYNPRPEWYFLFLFQALKFFPGHLEAVAAILLPGLAIALLVALPFLDRSPWRHPLDRPFITSGALAVMACWAYLTWAGYRSPLTNPIAERDPLVTEGARLYRGLKCSYCHQIKSKGGTIGPALDEVAGEESDEWLEKHFQDPQAIKPESRMPKLNLLESEIKALVAYIQSLGSGGPFTEEASKIVAENCSACHRIGAEGSDIAPDLSLIGSARDKDYIKNYIADPSQLNPSSTMPGYKGLLTDVEIEDIARYLASLGK